MYCTKQHREEKSDTISNPNTNKIMHGKFVATFFGNVTSSATERLCFIQLKSNKKLYQAEYI